MIGTLGFLDLAFRRRKLDLSLLELGIDLRNAPPRTFQGSLLLGAVEREDRLPGFDNVPVPDQDLVHAARSFRQDRNRPEIRNRTLG